MSAGATRTDDGGSLAPERRDFFISYTGADQAWAEWVAWVLEDAGYSTLVQVWDFGVGSHFVAETHEAIQSNKTVTLLSSAYLGSPYATPEWQAALAADPNGQSRKLLVFRLEECGRPGLLGQVVSEDLFGVDRDTAAARLLRAAEGKRRKPAAEPRFPGRATFSVASEPMFPGQPPSAFPLDATPAGCQVPQHRPRSVWRVAVVVTLAGIGLGMAVATAIGDSHGDAATALGAVAAGTTAALLVWLVTAPKGMVHTVSVVLSALVGSGYGAIAAELVGFRGLAAVLVEAVFATALAGFCSRLARPEPTRRVAEVPGQRAGGPTKT